MPRTTVSFSDEQYSWIEDTATELERNQSAIVRGLVDILRGEQSQVAREILNSTDEDVMNGDDITLHHASSESDEAFTTAHHSPESATDWSDRLDELEDRVDALEDADGEVEHSSGQPTEHGDGRGPSTPDPRGEGGETTDAEPESPDIQEILDGWPGPRTQKQDRRREVATVALEWLRDRDEPATATDFKNALLDDYPVEGQSDDTWWRKTVRSGLNQAVDAGVVEQREGFHDYRWVG